MRHFTLVLAVVAMVAPGAVLAQSTETLADIRQELSVLYIEIQKLKRELSTTGTTGSVAVGGSALERLGAIEGELQRLTSKTEQLEFNINRVVTDGTNRVGDLEFRLCELEAGCDISTLEPGSTLGGVPSKGSAGLTTTTEPEGPQLAAAEEADYQAAEAAMAAGNMAEAAMLFGRFREAYPGGPYSDRAGMRRGEALENSGELKQAARSYLDVFSSNETGPMAAMALYKVGYLLGRLNQTNQACVTLGEVGVRFPQAGEVAQARSAMQSLGCQ